MINQCIRYRPIWGILILLFLNIVSCTKPTEPEYIVQGEMGDTLEAKLTPLIKGVLEGYELPGLAIGIVKENEIIYARAFGDANKEHGVPLTIRTPFHMASNSKPFVATAIMQLVHQGKIDLDSTLVHYLPYFKMLQGPFERITIRQMLSHYSGMPDVYTYKWDQPYNSEDALERYVKTLSARMMVGNPGERFYYSSM